MRSKEAERRLKYFLSSLAMEMPSPPAVQSMASVSILTPVYKETIIYSMRELEEASNDGSAFVDVLQRLYPDEWVNFVERLGLGDLAKARYTEDAALGMQVRLWASLRGQTLARTVVGMQHFEAALKLQAELEAGREAGEAAEDEAAGEVAGREGGIEGGSAPAAAAWLSPKQAHALAQRKVRYICACQVYGDYVRSGDTRCRCGSNPNPNPNPNKNPYPYSNPHPHPTPRAADIELLLHMYPSLRVAYIERTSQPAALGVGAARSQSPIGRAGSGLPNPNPNPNPNP